ncbi:MAG: hypothetical protein COA78_18245 [Blastopirellula sp.]|nr:MAG: hypothetical protein COA78_18245 [Blastopirellula sp.]
MDVSILAPLAISATVVAASTIKDAASDVFSLFEGKDEAAEETSEKASSATGSIDGLFAGSGFLDKPMFKMPASRDEIASELANLQARVNSLLEANGIELEGDVRFTTDSSGKVRVKGDVENKEAIEQLINDDFDLSNDFRWLSSSISIQQAGERTQPYRDLYETDPEAAFERYGHLFSDSKQSTVDFVFSDIADPSFEEFYA